MIFLLCISAVLANFNTQYVTDQLEIQQTNLNSSKTYLVSMIITQLPINNYCLPLLQIIINNQTYNDSLAYSIKANIQKVYFDQTENITIKVSCNLLEYFQNQKNINKTMHFNLTLNEAKQHIQSPCQFPHYGQNCSLSIQQIQKEFSVTILILNNTWFYAYTILDNNNYEVYVQNGESLFGISIISFNKVNVTRLPSFLQNFVVLNTDNDENQISLSQTEDSQDSIYIIGLYNFNSTQIQEITITITNSFQNEEFPFWATILLISIVIFGLLLFLIILCHYRRQYKKITQIKPALDRKVLKKYMPTKKVDSKMSSDTCSVCLVQFELKEKYCQTPCNHYFHDQCLYDWTTKQANCPVCRQGLLENEINQLQEVKKNRNLQAEQLNNQESIKSKEDPPSQTYRDLPFLQLSSSPFRTQCKIELDCSPQGEHSPQIIQFDGSPQNLTNRNLYFQSDGIVESQN
ncbi:unnamed protein product [Paramecium primaurelia]|uniref:RING-type domain-containing protein n=1 Tax=Paramecium primaurelia TaxID=5886 RepID=A0A8S1KE24_PARPR|nr:unnamed protein product [Paramecium primaurelia]